MRWDEPLSAQSLANALDYAHTNGKLVQPGRIAYGFTINHSADLHGVADHLVEAFCRWQLPNRSLAMRHHCYNGKPAGWWSIAFLWTEAR